MLIYLFLIRYLWGGKIPLAMKMNKTVALLDNQLESDYRDLGYEPIRVPVIPLEERVKIILENIDLIATS